MSKLYSLDKSLVEEIKTTLTHYSERILLGGLQIKNETKKTWLQSIEKLNDSLPNKSLCIGLCDIGNFEYLQCNLDLSSKGFVNLETTLSLDDNHICFEIYPKMKLSTDKSPWKNDFQFGPTHIKLCPLSYREIKDLTPVIKSFYGDTFIATIMDLLIRDSKGIAFDPEKDPNGEIVCFFSPFKNRKQEVSFSNQFSNHDMIMSQDFQYIKYEDRTANPYDSRNVTSYQARVNKKQICNG